MLKLRHAAALSAVIGGLTVPLSGSAVAAAPCSLSPQTPSYVFGDAWHRGIKMTGTFHCNRSVRGRWDLSLMMRTINAGEVVQERVKRFQPGKTYHAYAMVACVRRTIGWEPVLTRMRLLDDRGRVVARVDSSRLELAPC
ncbi:hypothetical protein [Conexibacter sp. CPCC 206217]|uniref:hypothetical protein n=1 Tax=Conexibacter sp. CPCC 206217 TaxID=3064574 RepID=UPI00271E6D0B|nr:hypothetical protein [Conexibacter sp. CPCC 206217]MDO8213466.1 hypothetical protein [Conexibacter sp. CPCC 206217]